MANRSDLDRTAHTLRGLLPSGEPVSSKNEHGGPALKPEFTLEENGEPVEENSKANNKAALKAKRMEEKTKRIGIRQGEKTRRVEARNK
jgi:hypothetical protein